MKKVGLFIIATGLVSTLHSQYEFSSFTATGRGGATTFVTDYQAVGINPGNLGWQYKFDDKSFAMGMLEMSYSVRSEALNKDGLKSIFRSATGKQEPFTYQQKLDGARDFTGAGFAINMDFSTMGMAYHNEKFGGIAFRMNDRIHSFVRLGGTASDILFLGKTASYFDRYELSDGSTVNAEDFEVNDQTRDSIVRGFASSPQLISQVMAGSQLQLSWTREYNLSYGRKIVDIEDVFQLSAGIGLKYIQGFGLLDIDADENGNLTAYSALTPFFPIDYGNAAALNPSTVTQSGKLPNSVGRGYGLDIGLSAIIAEKLKLGFAITNIGSVTWDGNVYTVQDTVIYDTDNSGLENYNIFTQIAEIASNDGLFKWGGLEEKKVALPTMIRMGASIELGEKVEVGLDVLIPGNTVPGNFAGAIIGFGGDVQLLPFMRISAGFLSSANYGTQIPMGIILGPQSGGYEFGIASRDAYSFFKDKGSTLSMAIGFMRFRF
jgi:hypothetical protein